MYDLTGLISCCGETKDCDPASDKGKGEPINAFC